MRTVTGWALVLRWGLVVSLVATVLVGGHASPADAVEEAKAASGPPLHIALFISSREDLCHDPGDAAAVRRLATVEQRRINSRGGVAGRPIEIKVLDDGRDEARAAANMRTALADRNMLGMVGMSNSTRAKAVFDALGKEIGERIPFLRDFRSSVLPAVNATMRPQDEERVPVMAAFRVRRLVRPRNADSVMSDAMRDSFRSLLGASGMAGDHRIRAADGKTDAAEVDQVVAALAAEKPDMIFLAVGSRAAPAVISRLIAANLTPALFVTGRIDALPADLRSAYPSPLYQLAWDTLPDSFNSRLRTIVGRAPKNPWVFEGAKNARAPGWSTGACKERSEPAVRDPFDAANLRAINVGARYADMVALIARTARHLPQETVSRR